MRGGRGTRKLKKRGGMRSDEYDSMMAEYDGKWHGEGPEPQEGVDYVIIGEDSKIEDKKRDKGKDKWVKIILRIFKKDGKIYQVHNYRTVDPWKIKKYHLLTHKMQYYMHEEEVHHFQLPETIKKCRGVKGRLNPMARKFRVDILEKYGEEPYVYTKKRLQLNATDEVAFNKLIEDLKKMGLTESTECIKKGGGRRRVTRKRKYRSRKTTKNKKRKNNKSRKSHKRRRR